MSHALAVTAGSYQNFSFQICWGCLSLLLCQHKRQAWATAPFLPMGFPQCFKWKWLGSSGVFGPVFIHCLDHSSDSHPYPPPTPTTSDPQPQGLLSSVQFSHSVVSNFATP